MKRRVSWLDVFSDRPFAGNQLAVVVDGDGLSDDFMQSFAAEVTISETTFLQDEGRRLRTFTPVYELPVAGHPTVGTAIELARRGVIPSTGTWTFETGAGPIGVAVDGSRAVMTQGEPRLGEEIDTRAVAEALQVEPEVVVAVPQFSTTTGIDQLFAQVRDHEMLKTIEPSEALVAALPGEGLVAFAEVEDGHVAQRFFAPGMGIFEDPATGSAAGGLAALRVFRGAEPGPLLITQGDEIGRPSRIEVEVGGSAGAPADVRVGGTAVLILEGHLDL